MPQPNEHVFYSRPAGSSDPWTERARRVPPGPGVDEVQIPGLTNGQAHEVALDIYDSGGRLRPPAKRDQGTVTPQAAAVTPVSQGFAVDEVWAVGSSYDPFASDNAPTVTFRCTATISSADTGILWEQGGDPLGGTALYAHNGSLWLAAYRRDHHDYEIEYPLPASPQELLIETALSDHNLMRLYVGAQLEGSHVGSVYRWARAYKAAAGVASQFVITTRGGWGGGEGAFTGALSDVEVMVGEVPS